MPPAPPTKFARTSIEGWSRKRSVSPASAAKPSRKMVSSSLQPSPELISGTSTLVSEPHFIPKRSDDGYFYEEEYRDEHLACMLEMEVRVTRHLHSPYADTITGADTRPARTHGPAA